MKACHQTTRSGTILICVLVCLLIASGLAAETARSALRVRREVRMRQQLRQTDCLLDAGVMRAVRRLKQSADYAGEQWRLSAATISFEDALVTIVVTGNDDALARRVEVIASLRAFDGSVGTSPTGRTQRTHTFNYPLPQSSNEE